MKSNNYNLISTLLQDNEITHFGWTKLNRPLSIGLYSQWIDNNHHHDMDYLKNHLSRKENPMAQFSKAHSAIVFAIPYFPHPWPLENKINSLSVALYAKGKDYHREIPKQLMPLLSKLRLSFPEEVFELYTDSAPILERDLAYRSGLGWIGKNTCLIHPKLGSLFFIAEIYTSLKLENENPWSSDFCGKCNKCIEACPTKALSNDKVLEPLKCISYWTIESKEIPPEFLRKNIGNWLFGCDICQTVCPWNQKHLSEKVETNSQSTEKEQIRELDWILTSSRKSLAKTFSDTPLARAAGWKLQRNALIIAANNGFTELAPSIKLFLEDSKLKDLAEWALKTLLNDTNPSRPKKSDLASLTKTTLP